MLAAVSELTKAAAVLASPVAAESDQVDNAKQRQLTVQFTDLVGSTTSTQKTCAL
jgi:hypothetical protein